MINAPGMAVRHHENSIRGPVSLKHLYLDDDVELVVSGFLSKESVDKVLAGRRSSSAC